jgi:hypothetical protein
MTSPTPTNKTIDSIAEQFITRETHKGSVNRVRHQFKLALLTYIKEEVIGEDEDLVPLTPLPLLQKDAWARNVFRGSQRNRLEQSYDPHR